MAKRLELDVKIKNEAKGLCRMQSFLNGVQSLEDLCLPIGRGGVLEWIAMEATVRAQSCITLQVVLFCESTIGKIGYQPAAF